MDTSKIKMNCDYKNKDYNCLRRGLYEYKDMENQNFIYCKYHRFYCSKENCKKVAVSTKKCFLNDKIYQLCKRHLKTFDDGAKGQTSKCFGEKCRREIFYEEDRIWCTDCHGDFDPWWNMVEIERINFELWKKVNQI